MKSENIKTDDAITDFYEIIESCRQYLIEQQHKEEASYNYALLRIFSSILLTSSETVSLLREGYPEGALALSRRLYEGLIITDFMIKKYHENDNKVLERFLYAHTVSAIKEDLCILEYKLKEDSNENEKNSAKKLIGNLKKQLNDIRDEIGISKDELFKDYWWTGYKSFAELASKTDFSRDYMYIKASNKIHFNASSIFNYIDTSEQGILIGDSERGAELPLWFATTVFTTIVGLIYSTFPCLCNDKILARCWKLYEKANFLMKNKV